jgi:hypothetical protein
MPMAHINLDAQAEAVKQFFLSLPADPEGSVFEVNGRAVARVVPAGGMEEGAPDEDGWTEAQDELRCMLIDEEIAGTLTLGEATDLQRLQRAMLRHRRRVAPRPLEDARRLCQELLAKASQTAGRRHGRRLLWHSLRRSSAPGRVGDFASQRRRTTCISCL